MGRRNRRRPRVSSIYSFAIAWLILSGIFPMYELGYILLTAGISVLVAYLVGRAAGRREQNKQAQEAARQTSQSQQQSQPRAQQTPGKKKSYGPEIDPIVEEGNKALSEMGRLYMSIRDPEIRVKINELMRITDKIVQDAIQDPSDIPQIQKFMNYYLPTTLKLLNTYDRMSAQGIEGENLDKTMKSITDMLDDAIAAYKRMLDSLFADQAMDIETEIQVMNTMLAREGLNGVKDFEIKKLSAQAAAGEAAAVQQQ